MRGRTTLRRSHRSAPAVKTGRLLTVLVAALLLGAPLLEAEDPPDPGTGFDYTMYGYSPPAGASGPGNRAMLLLNIDDPFSPRPTLRGSNFKLLAANVAASGRLDIAQTPTRKTLIGTQTAPQRFLFSFKGVTPQGAVTIEGDAALEANNLHYLRAVIDVVHNGQRTRYLVDCKELVCDER